MNVQVILRKFNALESIFIIHNIFIYAEADVKRTKSAESPLLNAQISTSETAPPNNTTTSSPVGKNNYFFIL